MTIMFLAFDGSPNILRLDGKTRVIHQNYSEWDELPSHLSLLPDTRKIFDLNVDLV